MQLGDIKITNPLIAAPMAGISDQPHRQLCYHFGAAMAVSEMLSANLALWGTDKSRLRQINHEEPGIRAVQILGYHPDEMAQAAKVCVAQGAQIIDINMGCPAKKVNKKFAGSALMQDPLLAKKIMCAVVNAVDVPVTLKTRTGWDTENKNCLEIAEIAEKSGIQAITIHGRTRACLFNNQAEYVMIKKVKQNIGIPVIANGDIFTPQQAKFVLEYTQADGIMIGRGSQGRPWIFEEILYYLETGKLKANKSIVEIVTLVIQHVLALHQFYGAKKGLRIARKHVAWYLKEQDFDSEFRHSFNAINDASKQIDGLKKYLNNLYN